MNQTLVGYAALAGSVTLHALAVTRSAAEIAPRRPAPPSVVELSVTTPAPPAPRPVPSPELVAPPKPRPLVPAAPGPRAAAEPVSAPPPELTGITLTSDGTTSFDAPAGSGGARDGTIVAAIAPRAKARPPSTRAQAPAPPRLVSLSELSRKPVPPSLGAALRRNYPHTARGLGKSGDAKVRARVEATGEVRVASVTFETSAGFGEACRRTLLGSRWSAPLDRAGRPAATFITYQCKFRIGD